MKVLQIARSRKARVLLSMAAVFAAGTGIAVPRSASAAGTVTVDPATPQEGNVGTPSFDVTFRLSEASGSTVTVAYATADGTAKAASDYVAQSGTVEFAPNQTTKSVTFQTRGDQIFEGNETFTINLSNATGGYSAGSPGTVTIQDDDLAPTFSVIAPPPVEEGDSGTKPMNFVVKLSKPSGSGTPFYVFTANPRDPTEFPPVSNAPNPATESGEGVVKADYTTVDGTQYTIPAGETQITVPVTVLSDLRDEFDEFVELQVRSGAAANSPELAFGTGKIVDDDAPARLHVSDPVAVQEPDTPCGHLAQPACTTFITFTVTVNGATDKRIVVDYATEDRSATSGSSDPNADYIATSGSGDPEAQNPGDGLNFVVGDTTETVQVPIRGDLTAEPDELFAFTLSNPVNATLGDGQAFGLITNDDGGSYPTVSVSDAAAAAESSGGTPGTSSFTITVNRPALNTANVNVCYATADGSENGTGASAVAGSDYTATSNCTTINWPSTTATVNVPLINDNKNEPDEFFQLQILSAGNAAITDPVGEAKITDDDAAPTLSIADKTVTEGTAETPTTASLTVTLSAASGQTVTVQCSTPQPNSGTATPATDYTVITGQTLTFVPGDTSENCDVPVVADSNDEDNETVGVALSGPSGANINDGTGVLTITDDDAPPTVSIGNTVVTEGSAGNTTATFPVTLSAASGKTVTVQASTAPPSGTATPASDYVAKTETLTFAPGQTTKDFNVTVVADEIEEADETFTATLSGPTNATLGSPSTATATIKDDEPKPEVSVNSVEVNEGAGKATFTISRSGSASQDLKVRYKTGDDTAKAGSDYTAVPETEVTIPAGQSAKTVDVNVANDTLDEIDETFDLILVSADNAQVSESGGIGTATIIDDDAAPTLSISDGTHASGKNEGDPVSFALTLSTASGRDVAVTIATADGTATDPADYTGVDATEVLIPAGQTSKALGVATIEDSIDEPNETFTMNLSDPEGATIADGTGIGTIVDDDDAPADAPTLSVNDASAAEGDPVTFTVTASKVWTDDIVVTVTTSDGTATTGDYTPLVSFPVTIATGQTTATFNVATTEDVTDEPNETFTVTLSNPSNATLADATGTGTITDDDSPANAPKLTTGPGPGGGPHIKVFEANGSGPTVEFMDGSTENGGKRVARGDLDGDGIDEIITGSGPNNAAIVTARKATGELLASTFAYSEGRFFGGVFVAAGDVDGDGKDEIVTNAGPGGGSHVRVWELVGNSLVGNVGFFAYPGFAGGGTVATGDVDGDGDDEIITGAGPGGGPHVKVFNAAGAEQFGFFAYAYSETPGQPTWRGGVNVAAGDLDGDGKAEIVTGPWAGGGPHLRTFNHDGTLRNNGIFTGSASFSGGVTVAVGDLDGDGKAEILVGAMSQTTVYRAFKGTDLSAIGSGAEAYPGFAGGVFVAIGNA